MIGELGFVHWVAAGLRATLAMVWMTWWPLVFGFLLAGLLQSLSGRDRWRARLGSNAPVEVVTASLLGAVSSSCSYAASAMARALFARGASWRNALVFMIASTNLVIELGVVIAVMLGGSFLAAQLLGGVVMIVVVSALAPLVWRRGGEARLLERVRAESPAPTSAAGSLSWRSRQRYETAARYAIGDLTMIRKELLAGFLVAGFASAHVPPSWWRNLLFSGHGVASVAENVVVAPLLASVSSVCSVGNVPLAAALWEHGVAFGGVVAFILADLIALPIVLIYRRFYGGRATIRLFVLLWFAMSLSGAAVDGAFSAMGLVPSTHQVRALGGQFPLGTTLVLNLLAASVFGVAWATTRRRPGSGVATDPVCAMSVDVTSPGAVAEIDGETWYFCSPRCRDRYVAERGAAGSAEKPHAQGGAT